ncbi:MAG: hypothetical protein JWM25_837 [Thermoleophilia bacterium]|nr:hypothetical protein [Thermoleophilia bacterium]
MRIRKYARMQLSPLTGSPSAPTLSPASASAPAPYAFAAAASPRGSGWFGGVVTFTGKGPHSKAIVTLERIVGRQGGYDTVRGATIAAAMLTKGAAQGSVAITRDGDGRHRIYEASLESLRGESMGKLAFEFGLPWSPTGARMDHWLFAPAEGLLEMRDGKQVILPNPYGPGEFAPAATAPASRR